MAGKSKRPVRPAARQPTEKKKNLLASLGLDAVDYKDTGTLRVFISERGKIRSRRVTGLTVQQQRKWPRPSRTPARWRCCPTPAPLSP